jgi:hypothetical protein
MTSQFFESNFRRYFDIWPNCEAYPLHTVEHSVRRDEVEGSMPFQSKQACRSRQGQPPPQIFANQLTLS